MNNWKKGYSDETQTHWKNEGTNQLIEFKFGHSYWTGEYAEICVWNRKNKNNLIKGFKNKKRAMRYIGRYMRRNND